MNRYNKALVRKKKRNALKSNLRNPTIQPQNDPKSSNGNQECVAGRLGTFEKQNPPGADAAGISDGLSEAKALATELRASEVEGGAADDTLAAVSSDFILETIEETSRANAALPAFVRFCVAVCCSMLQCVAVCCSVSVFMRFCGDDRRDFTRQRCLACVCKILCCSVSQCLQCVAVCRSVLLCVAVCRSVSQCVAVYCSVLQCVAVCCSVLQCVCVREIL